MRKINFHQAEWILKYRPDIRIVVYGNSPDTWVKKISADIYISLPETFHLLGD